MKNASKFVYLGASATNASQLTAEIDTKGFNYAKFSYFSAITNAPSTQSNNIVESDASAGTTNAISGLVQGTDYTLSTASNSTSVAKVVYGVPLVGRKRYLKVTATCATTGQIFLACELSDPADTISVRKAGTAATDGGGSVVNI